MLILFHYTYFQCSASRNFICLCDAICLSGIPRFDLYSSTWGQRFMRTVLCYFTCQLYYITMQELGGFFCWSFGLLFIHM